jgi:hypothetical protein
MNTNTSVNKTTATTGTGHVAFITYINKKSKILSDRANNTGGVKQTHHSNKPRQMNIH